MAGRPARVPRVPLRREATFMPRAWGVTKRHAGAVARARATRFVPRGVPVAATQEHKFFDLDIDDAVVAAGATIAQDSCNQIAQGLTDKTRIGRKVTIRAIGWRFDMTWIALGSANMSAVAVNDTVRVILYLDKQANKLTAATTGILASADYQSFNNLSNKGRFRILMDRSYDFHVTAAAADFDANIADVAGTNLNDAFYKSCNIPIEFSAGTGALTEITSNNVGVMTLSKNGVCSFTSKMRVRFTDS